MKIKGIIVFFVVFSVVVLGIAAFFKFRPHEPVSAIPQEFAQVPEKPKLIAEFTAKYHLRSMTGFDRIVPKGFTSANTTGARSIYSVAFSPVDASLIASINRNGTINLWDRDNIEVPVKVLRHPEIFASIGFSPDGKLLASAHWRLVLWDVATGKKINTLETSFNQFAFSPDSKRLATIPDGVKLWDIQDPKKVTEVATVPFDKAHKVYDSACAVDISPDGKWIAVGRANGTVNVWDLQTEQLVKVLDTSLHLMDYLKFSPNNKYMVVGGEDHELYPYHAAKGYIMWELPSWERKGEVLRGPIENMAISPDEKLCATANHLRYSGRGIEIWDITNGAPITSIVKGSPISGMPHVAYPLEARDVAFSQDGRLVVSGDEQGIIRVWELTPQQLALATKPLNVVRILYYLPTEKTPPPNIIEKIDATLKSVQDLYADEMERHGFGRKTFTYETDANGTAKVYLVKGSRSYIPDFSSDIWFVIFDERSDTFERKLNLSGMNRTFEFPSKNEGYKDNIWSDDIDGYSPGRLVTARANNLNRKHLIYLLRNAFGLPYRPLNYYDRNALKKFFNRVNNMMPWTRKWHELTRCEAAWLDKNRFFNLNQPFFDKRPEIEMTVSNEDSSDTRLFKFAITDEDGIHQAQLFVPIDMESQRWRKKFHECQELNGKKKASAVFRITDPRIEAVMFRMIDIHGNIAQGEFGIRPKTDEPAKEH